MAACAAVNREPDLIPQNEKSPLDHLGPIRAGKKLARPIFINFIYIYSST